MKIKRKQIIAGLLAVTLAMTAIVPTAIKRTQAFESQYGVCIDKTGFSANHYYHGGDVYTNKLKDMNEIVTTYGQNSNEYKEALAYNVQKTEELLGGKENALKVFWAGIVTWLTGGISQYGDLEEVNYWHNYAQQGYADSVAHGYIGALQSYNFQPMTENEIGMMLHGHDEVITRDPFLTALTNYDQFFNSDYRVMPQTLPRLSNGWLASYQDWLTGETGRALWPTDLPGHEVSVPEGTIPTIEQVQQAALDMETNKNYWFGVTTSNPSSGKNDTDDGDEDIDEESIDDDDEDEDDDSSNNKNNSSEKNTSGEYWIDMKEAFFNNASILKVWDGTTWQSINLLNELNQTRNINGWEVSTKASDVNGKGHWYVYFKWAGSGEKTALNMYFEIPKNAAPDANASGFDEPIEFVARYMRIYTCDSCPKGMANGVHQRHISFYHDTTNPRIYPCLRLGSDDPTPTEKEGDVHFDIFSHNEDWDSDYNVQLTKYDYETGKELEGSVFELYEKFDDKDQINRGRDGAVELYEGIDNDSDQEWQSTYKSSPVVWDNYRLVGSYRTNSKGYISDDVQKSYHYEKTFCDGHPAPKFVHVPELEEDEFGNDNSDEIEAAQEENKRVATKWLAYWNACTNMAENDRPGVHFHWKIDDVNKDYIEEIASSGGDEGEDPNDQAGTQSCPGLDTSYESSGCHQDCQDTYDKFINLRYSYTWVENKARDGYILHDIHTDDVPIEVITTNSSQAGAESTFGKEYGKDITVNSNVSTNSLEDTSKKLSFHETMNFLGITAYGAEDEVQEEENLWHKTWNVFEGKTMDVIAFFKNLIHKATDSNVTNDEDYDEEEISDYEIDFENDKIATSSNANQVDTAYQTTSFRIENVEEDKPVTLKASIGDAPEESDYMAIWEASFKSPYVGGKNIDLGPEDNWSHCNDKDGEGNMWRVYDHRTEGEIHFNKRDLYLANHESDEYNPYADANGDGKLEGAVYGLFAAENIDHPDGKTGTIYQKGDLVAIATTDRNGDGSFMVNTEAPGTVYNYEKGTTETTAWNKKAPNNFYRSGAKSTSVQPHVKFTNGKTTEYYSDDYTEDTTYKGGLTQRLYDINEQNNMNSWIGRPLFLGQYYIKELSRSEGYELSVNGKLDTVTNNGADLNVNTETKNGSVKVSQNLYIQGQETVGKENEPFFEVTSNGTEENGGYDIVLTKLPAGTKFYRHDSATKTGKISVIDHYENVPKVDAQGNPVYKRADSTGIAKLKTDGSGEIESTTELANGYANSLKAASRKTFDNDKIQTALKGNARQNADGSISYPDYDLLQNQFTMGRDSTYYIRFVKSKLEEALRTAKISTPKGTNGGTYSTIDVPVYSRGIRKGDVDRYGVSGVNPGEIAKTTAYGPQIVKLTFAKTNSLGQPITNGDLVYNILQYYMDHSYYNFGGIDKIEENGNSYDVYIYAYNTLVGGSFVTSTNEDDAIIYKRIEFVPDDTSFEPYYVYVPYTTYDDSDSFGKCTSFEVSTKYGYTTVNTILYPDVTIDGRGNLQAKTTKVPICYEIGDIIHDKNGNPIQDTESKPVYVEKEINVIEKTWTEVNARYENGKYIIHVNIPDTTAYGEKLTDKDGNLTLEFKAVVPEKNHKLTAAEAIIVSKTYNLSAGDIVSSGMYEVEVLKAKAYAYLDYKNSLEESGDTYIKEVTLSYPSDKEVSQDGDGIPGQGTRANPIKVNERPINQQIKVVKDIQTNPNSEEYMNDTYSEVHEDNLSKGTSGTWLDKTKDWLTNLLNGDVKDQSASKIPGFRFKAYLKSNLERLYRDENGTIVWLDRNGNALSPQYKDTNNDGNYDTFVWQSGNDKIDFPEENRTSNDSIQGSNVQKIYTQVEHNTKSTTTGDISNNTWAKYNDPQTGNTTNIGELRGYNTSQDGDNGIAIKSNASLYSYDDKNTNTAKTDKINQDANKGYTRLLETSVETIEDGADKTREVEQYNYEKFFDAMSAANTDKWDNDMYSSKKNYPGQHLFDTFEERYQKDDADEDGTLENTDGKDKDGTAQGDRDTSFKPFQWIREHLFGTTDDAKNDYPATHDNDNLENNINTSAKARSNAEASDAVRQFAIKWYLDDEVAKLVTNNGNDEDVAKTEMSYQEEVYDAALYNALEKAYNYLKPFYTYDLDTMYSIVWDSASNGGTDNDNTTLSADVLYETTGTDEGQSKNGYYYGVSAYLPYGTYVLVEQQPYSEKLDDFDNKHYQVDKPKEVTLPAVYNENGNTSSPEDMNDFYEYNSQDTEVDLAKKYKIRFNEEWANNHTDDLRKYVIRAHGYDGDYEVYKYGLDVDKLIGTINYTGGNYSYAGWSIIQDVNDPLKNYYNSPLVDSEQEGGNKNSHYFADEKNKTFKTASGIAYPSDAIEKRYHYGSISENSGTANDVIYQLGNKKDDNNPSGFYFKDNVKTMTGNQTAYEGKYASMLVPWSITTPEDSGKYSSNNYTGYADSKFRNRFYSTKLRIEKLDSETGENLLHDDAIFSIYAASRYTSKAEIIAAGAPEGTEVGDVKFYMEDTQISGSKEFLEAMNARNIEPVMRGSVGLDELYTGIVSAGTPVCVEDEQIIMEDYLGAKTGKFKVYSTLGDLNTMNEEDNNKSYKDQNVGYLITPQPLGAGVYVLAETKAPNGYAKTKPIAVEVYSDGVNYYMNGLMDSKVEATIYKGNLMNK